MRWRDITCQTGSVNLATATEVTPSIFVSTMWSSAADPSDSSSIPKCLTACTEKQAEGVFHNGTSSSVPAELLMIPEREAFALHLQGGYSVNQDAGISVRQGEW